MQSAGGMTRMLRYAMTGGTAALVDLGLFALLLGIGMAVFPAGTASFAVAVVVNFSLSSRYVFRMAMTRKRFMGFVLGALIGLSVNMGVTVVLAHLGLLALLAKASGIATAFFVNYAINARIVYRT